jgi:hypothetical protein
MRTLHWTALLLSSTACFGGADDPQYALLEPRPGTLGIGAVQQLETTRQPGGLPRPVYGHFELSEYAFERFESLEARVTVSSGGSLPGKGFHGTWGDESSGLPIQGRFQDDLSTIWAADLVADACTQLPCVVSFAIAPAGVWNSPPVFEQQSTEPLQYELRASLEVRGQYRSEVEELDDALEISLGEAP